MGGASVSPDPTRSIFGNSRKIYISKALFMIFVLTMVASNRSGAQCSCSLIVGSGAGPNLANLSQVSAAQTVAGGCIRIKGTFYVDSGLTWDLGYNTKVYLDPGSGITVNSGCTFKADTGCMFTKCDPNAANWGQITVLSGSSIDVDSCYLHHATTAFSILPNATFSLTRNVIDSFVTGINIIGTQNPLMHQVLNNKITNGTSTGIKVSAGNKVRINYNWLYDADKTMIGIDMTTGSRAITVNDCIFANLPIGVQAQNTRDDITLNGIIFGGDIGVSAYNCWLDFGIYRSTIRATKEGVWFRDHQTSLNGNPMQFGTLVIDGSYVSSITHSAIKIERTYGHGRLHVANNIVRPAYDPPAFGYYGIEINDVPQAQLFVQRNYVGNLTYLTNPVSAPGGIYLYKCKRQNLVSDNEIDVGNNGQLNFGITAAESPNLQVVGNSVNGGPPGMNMAAISMELNHENLLLCCNTTDSSAMGLNLGGDIENCDISGTQFFNHVEALYYDMVASAMGITQFHRGNDWSSANTTWDAFFNGSPNFVQPTRYFVDYSFLSDTNKISVNGGGNTNNWFQLENHSEDTCGTTTYCGHTPYEPELGISSSSDTLTGNDYWAIDTLDDEAYSAIHWEARRYLYEKLVKNPDLLNESQDIVDFFDEAEAGNIGKFYAVEDGLTRLYEPPANMAGDYYAAQDTLAGLNAGLDALDDEIAEAGPSELPALLAEREDLVIDIEEFSQVVAVYDSIIAAGVSQKIDDLQAINSAVDPEADYETWQQAINGLFLHAIDADDWDFSAGEQAAIDTIAALCPLYAGRAVYEARALQEYYRVPVWNDCPLVEERSNRVAKAMRSDFSVYPNPANNQVQIDFNLPVGTGYQVQLVDMMGRVIETISIAAGAKQVALSLAKCHSGVYLVQVSNLARLVSQQKLSVIR